MFVMRRPDLVFGPPGDEWRYETSSRTYDLTRGRSPAWTVGTSQGPTETFISVNPHSTALVIVDMQNYFLHPDCRDHPAGLAAVDKTEKVIEKCRELGVQVRRPRFFVSSLFSPPVGLDAGVSLCPAESGRAAAAPALHRRGEVG